MRFFIGIINDNFRPKQPVKSNLGHSCDFVCEIIQWSWIKWHQRLLHIFLAAIFLSFQLESSGRGYIYFSLLFIFICYQRRIGNLVKNSSQLNAVKYFREKLRLRCLTGLWYASGHYWKWYYIQMILQRLSVCQIHVSTVVYLNFESSAGYSREDFHSFFLHLI